MAVNTLMQWGLLQFKIWPLNIHEFEHKTGTDFAKKEIVESIPHREWMGEDDETITVQGRVFPYHIKGDGEALNWLEGQRREGWSHQLMDGRGTVKGWFVCEQLVRRHSNIHRQGQGRVITFQAQFSRVDIPRERADTYYNNIFSAS